MYCVDAMCALVVFQKELWKDSSEARDDKMVLACLKEYVWNRIRKYNRDSRMSASGKDAFLEQLIKKFAENNSAKFIAESETWWKGILKKEKEAEEEEASNEAELNDASHISELKESIKVKLDKLETELEKLPKEEDRVKESQLIGFSRHLKNTREQENSYQGYGYALSVYFMYAVLTFIIVYQYESSHCSPDMDPIYVVPFYDKNQHDINMTQLGEQLDEGDINAIKTAKTSTIFGGVYGPSANAGLYVFNGEDSNDWYI